MSVTEKRFKLKAGIVGSLVGGLAMAIMLGMMGAFPGIASMVGSDSAIVGFLVHMVISFIFGIAFAYFAGLVKANPVALGAIFGIIIWVIGPLLLMPMLTGDTGGACGEASKSASACGEASKSASACGEASKSASACGEASKSASACGEASKSASACGTVGNACGAGGSSAIWLGLISHILYGLITGVTFKAVRN
jgi:hypothetical protein